MPVVATSNGRGGMLPVFTCEVCGGPASYGFGCLTREGKPGFHAGKWYCATLGGGPACKASAVAVAQAAPSPLLPAFPPAEKELF